MATKVPTKQVMTCACGKTIVLEEDGAWCDSCPAEYNRYGHRTDIPAGYPPSHYYEDKAYAESGLDNLWGMENEEIDRLCH